MVHICLPALYPNFFLLFGLSSRYYGIFFQHCGVFQFCRKMVTKRGGDTHTQRTDCLIARQISILKARALYSSLITVELVLSPSSRKTPLYELKATLFFTKNLKGQQQQLFTPKNGVWHVWRSSIQFVRTPLDFCHCCAVSAPLEFLERALSVSRSLILIHILRQGPHHFFNTMNCSCRCC